VRPLTRCLRRRSLSKGGVSITIRRGTAVPWGSQPSAKGDFMRMQDELGPLGFTFDNQLESN
jgi:hypothetical protein